MSLVVVWPTIVEAFLDQQFSFHIWFCGDETSVCVIRILETRTSDFQWKFLQNASPSAWALARSLQPPHDRGHGVDIH